MQVRWFLREGLIIAERLQPARSRRLLSDVEDYLDALQALLSELGRNPGHRRLIVPTRAGGLVSVFEGAKLDERARKRRFTPDLDFPEVRVAVGVLF